mgnify:CR=1 FL=1
MQMTFQRKLPIPKEVKEEFPLSEKMAQVKAQRDAEIKAVFDRSSDKFILIIGPCSADHREPVLEYISRLRKVAEQVSDKIIMIPRIYTNKPRTTGQGYKGMLHQPNPDEKPDMYKGLLAIRDLHMEALRDFDFSCADEMLYPDNHRYLSDLLAYVAVGARSVENQEHRLTASGLGIPVGMKNPTSGDISVMLNAIAAAQMGHTFIYRGWEVETTGNPMAHAILRGYVNRHGESLPNYHFEDLEHLYEAYRARNLRNMALIVDANHANSRKDPHQQRRICKEVLHSCRQAPHLKGMVKGFMVESYLEPGCQSIGGGIYGKSITDPCIGWDDTQRLVLELAELV